MRVAMMSNLRETLQPTREMIRIVSTSTADSMADLTVRGRRPKPAGARETGMATSPQPQIAEPVASTDPARRPTAVSPSDNTTRTDDAPSCRFSDQDRRILARFWHPVALSREVAGSPWSTQLLDEPLVLYRLSDGVVRAAVDRCPHRGARLSLGRIERDRLVCPYHGFSFDGGGRCVDIPAHPGMAISAKLRLSPISVHEAYGLVWARLLDDGPAELPAFDEWSSGDSVQILPESLLWETSAGRQMESFLDVGHFAFVHRTTFGESENTAVPNYKVERTTSGFAFDYVSTVSNYSVGFKHLNPPGFAWSRRFQVHLPFCAKLSIGFPGGGSLHILNAASPVSACRTRVFVPICRDFDKDAPLEESLAFNYRVFDEDRRIVESQRPKQLPLDLREEAHIPADLASITYRQLLAELGLGAGG